jgi:hypothetical protein
MKVPWSPYIETLAQLKENMPKTKSIKEKSNNKKTLAIMEPAPILHPGAAPIMATSATPPKVRLVITTTITLVPVTRAAIQAQLRTITSPNIKR